MSYLYQPFPPTSYSHNSAGVPVWCDEIPGLTGHLMEYGSHYQAPHMYPHDGNNYLSFYPYSQDQASFSVDAYLAHESHNHHYSPERHYSPEHHYSPAAAPMQPTFAPIPESRQSPPSSPEYAEEPCCAPSPCSASSANPLFGKRVDEFFTEPGVKEFFCGVCQSDSKLHYDGNKITASCDHYQCCNECRSRLVRQLLRCSHCCDDVVGNFPVCGDQCQVIAQKLGQGLSTTGCPRCGQKLSKETCGSECNRTTSRDYKRARRKLLKCTATMVLRPEHCESQPQLGARPCSHFTKCKTHGCITQGRANQPRCPACKDENRRGSERGPGRKINIKSSPSRRA